MAAPAISCGRADGYARRRPEETVLYEVIAEHWPRFAARAEEQGGLPKFVVSEFEAYLRCGRLDTGWCSSRAPGAGTHRGGVQLPTSGLLPVVPGPADVGGRGAAGGRGACAGAGASSR